MGELVDDGAEGVDLFAELVVFVGEAGDVRLEAADKGFILEGGVLSDLVGEGIVVDVAGVGDGTVGAVRVVGGKGIGDVDWDDYPESSVKDDRKR